VSPGRSPAQYAVYAIRYAHRDAKRGEHFYGSIDNPDAAMPISYFVWLVVGDAGAVVVDTGFTAESAERRGRTYLMSPAEGVRALGADPETVETVVLTHLHYDHAGTASSFTAATFVLQDSEMAFWTGRHAARVGMPHRVVEPDDVTYLCGENFAGRVRWVDGDEELFPGLSVHRVGGHTAGMQIVRVATAAGPVVLASDATHFYENLHSDHPYAIVDSLPAMHAAFDRMRSMVDDPALIVPGHDPMVLERFPQAQSSLGANAVRIA
jgi:glyoxylase-like metal-dependent hydrolase (beta-lactamase superfamily II)